MNDMPLMSIIEDKEKENQKLAKLAELSSRLIEMEPESIDYQEIIAGFREIAGAQYAAFNLYKEDGKKFVTVAMAMCAQHGR